MRCTSCDGLGQVMGGGMIYKSCDTCNGKKTIETFEESLQYSQAVDNLVDKLKISKDEAIKLLAKTDQKEHKKDFVKNVKRKIANTS